MKRNRNTRIFATIVLGAIVIFTIFPMILLAVASFTDENTLIRNGYSLFPEKWSIEAYRYMRNQFSMIGRAYYVTFITTFVGTVCSMALTASLAYPMARRTFRYCNVLAFFVYFTMLFNGGIVPSYIMWTSYFKIKNTMAALIVPNLMMTAFNVMLVRNYYKNSIPEALYEAAQLDGANELQTFILVAIPLGVVAAVRQNSIFDKLCMTGSMLGVSVPTFWLGLIMMYFFSFKLGWLPFSGMGEPLWS